ncbi:hypothetical protein ABZ297_45620 [Nonomuraea sp. NPDC005983]
MSYDPAFARKSFSQSNGCTFTVMRVGSSNVMCGGLGYLIDGGES